MMELSFLTAQRKHVLGILDGLDDAAMRRPVLPSGWNCVGLVRHLAIDVERFWFRGVMAGEQEVLDVHYSGVDDGWLVGDDVPAAEVLELYRREIALADAVIEATPIDTPPRWWPSDIFGDEPAQDLRECLLHVMVETACHAGHLDAVRELIDGKRWLVLTG